MSLLFPAYLLGLLGLLLPWLLHRFSDQQPEEQMFPSHRFLEPTAPPVSRTRALKHWLLLALRVLSILLLCFLFAQPWLNQSVNREQSQIHHIIALDQSLSMRAQGRWVRAIEQADNLIDTLPETDTLELVAFAKDFNRVADDSESLATVRRALTELTPEYASADYGVLMQRLNQLAGEYSEPVKVWLISDQQQSALPAQLNALYAPGVAAWEPISVAEQSQKNVHLSATAQSSDGVNMRVSVQLRTSRAQADVSAPIDSESISTVQVRFGDQLLAEERVSLGMRDVQSIVFDELILPPGENPLLQVALLEEDALEDDNALSLPVRQANPTPVVLLQTERTTRAGASVFMTTSLETDSQATVTILNGTADRVPPEIAHIVAPADLTEASIALDILQFVDTDGNALVYEGSTPAVNSSVDIQGVGIGFVDESHPLGLGQIDWFGTRFYELAIMALQEDDRVLLETADRQPVLVERPTNRGTLLLLNDSLDGLGSNLPLQPAFVSLVQAVLSYFDASTAIPDTLLVGSRLSLPGNVQLLDPDSKALLTLSDSTRMAGTQLDRPGLYSVVGARGEHTVRVLLDPTEADLSLASAEAIAAWRARYDESPNTGIAGGENSAVSDPIVLQADTSNRFALWQWILPLMVLIMLAESVLANRKLDVRRDGS